MVSPEFLERMSGKGVFSIIDEYLSQARLHPILMYFYEGRFLDLGTPQAIAEAETMLKNAPNKSMFEQMKTALATCTDEQRKQELETLLSSPAYAHRIGRLNDLDSKISDMCSRLANAEIGVDTAHLGDIIQRAYMQTVFDVTKGADYRAAFDLIPESRVKAILSTNWSGQMFSQRV